ncbi:MAG: LrgB family protein [Gemmatimonadaceae bacterium]
MSVVAPVLWLLVTIAVYVAARVAYARTKLAVFNPALVSIATMIALLLLTRTPYDDYQLGARAISFWLGPAIVALGVPLALQLPVMRRNVAGILLALVAGAVTGIVVAIEVAHLFGASDVILRSLATRSVTTPIAIVVTASLGGVPALAALVSIVSGAIGGSAGVWLLRRAGVRSRLATGLALGAAAHGLGTARAADEGETEGAASGMAMGAVGVLTALLAPLVARALIR